MSPKKGAYRKTDKLRYEITVINRDSDILYKNQYSFIKDSVEDLQKIMPMITERRLRSICYKDVNDSLDNYIKIIKI